MKRKEWFQSLSTLMFSVVILIMPLGLSWHGAAAQSEWTEVSAVYAPNLTLRFAPPVPPYNCNQQSDIPRDECNALKDLYTDTAGGTWTDNTDWLDTDFPCSWSGVTCSAVPGNVISLDLASNNLVGTLPTTLEDLPYLTQLYLEQNQISGGIPVELGTLTSMTHLHLHTNQLSGGIPVELGLLTALQELRLDANQLTGSIPAELTSLTALQILGLSSNQLTGSLPLGLENWTALQTLEVQDNQLTGSLPAALGSLTNLQILHVNENQFTGAIPVEIGNLTGLLDLCLAYNALQGEIPSEITSLTSLTTTDLSYNALSSSDDTVRTFLATVDPDWEDTQTIPPSDVHIQRRTETSAQVAWTPILYTGHGGYYTVEYSTSPGGPFSTHGQTADKTAASYDASGLDPEMGYYFRVSTTTPAHDSQQNDLTSDVSAAIHMSTLISPVSFDFDADSDVVVYRGGAWRFFDYASASFDYGVWTGTAAGCIQAPMDYDGDGAVEPTQLCGGAWHFYNDDGTYNKGIWTGGVPGDLPVPADYDGDGTDDVVVWRNGAWRFFDFATAGFDHGVWTGSPPHWLGGTNIPAPMDYDGDGAAEFTVFSGGPWHFYNDDGTYAKGIWTGGVAGDLPVPADYDGDGTEDVVLWRAGAWRFFDYDTALFDHGVWTGSPPHWTGGTSLPSPLDADGDGDIDYTVFSGGPWHFFDDAGVYAKGIWTGGVVNDTPISRRLLP